MFAPLAHHLRAAGVALDKHVAHRTLLDRLVAVPGGQVQHHHGVRSAAACHNLGAILTAGQAGMPAGQAQRAEFLGTGGTFHRHTLNM